METTTSTSLKTKTQQQKLKPRRKFGLLDEVKLAVAKGKHQASADWIYIPRKDLIKRFQYDYEHKNLYVHGLKFSPLEASVEEVLRAITILPPPEVKEVAIGKKLKSVPLFWRDPSNPYGMLRHFSFIKGSFLPVNIKSTQDLLDLYNRCEKEHKELEHHHPDGEGFNPSIENSFECVIDVYSCLLRGHTPISAYHFLLKMLATPKFSTLNSTGLYAALMHILIRGVSNSDKFKDSTSWRKSRTQEHLYHLNRVYAAGGSYRGDPILTADYMNELDLHTTAVRLEMLRVRQRYDHDYTKYRQKFIFAYAWHWGIFQQLSEVNKHRALSGCYAPVNELHGEETMFNLGAHIAHGINQSGVIDETLDKVGTRVEEAVHSAVSDERQELINQAQELIREVSSSAETISDRSLTRMERIIGKLNQSLDSALDAFESMKSLATGVFQQVIDKFKKIAGWRTDAISVDSILSALRDYILFINVESAPLRIILLISILKSLGLISIGFTYLSQILEYLNVTPTGAETAGDSYFSFSNLIYAVSAVFSSIVKGSVLTATEFWSMVRKLSEPMKHIHFIGSGCMGLTRIISFVKQAYEYILEWVQEKFFKREPKIKSFARNVVLWCTKVRWFSTEAGMNAMRLNENIRKQATTLYKDYLSYLAMCQEDPDLLKFKLDLERYKREVTIIYDYITRLDAMSSFCPTMFHIQFVGQPGVGKSFLTKTFCKNISKSLWPENNKESIYSYNANLEFFDGYAGQRIFMIDDCFRMQEPQHLTTLIGLITNTPVILPMAHLESKGTQLTSDVMVSSTNTAWPVGKDVLCMEAVHRRRHMLVEVVCDPDVRDKSTGQFSKALYLKKYAEKDLPACPHLTFNLLRPVPSDLSTSSFQTQSVDDFQELQHYAQKLKEANIKIMTPGSSNIDPAFYFSELNKPPEPFQLPCAGWTYEQLVHNFVVRYRSFRGMEQTYTSEIKYAAVERSILEMEALAHQRDEIQDGVFLPIGPKSVAGLVEKWFTDVEQPFGASDEIGQRACSGQEIPDLSEVELDTIIEELLTTGLETGLTLDEERERSRLLRARKNRPDDEPYATRNRLKTHQSDGRIYVRLNPHCTRWEEYSMGLERLKPNARHLEGKFFKDFCLELSEMIQMDAQNPHEELEGKKAALKDLWTIENGILKFVFSAQAYYPNNPIFGSMAGKKSGMPLYFLKNLKYDEVTSDWKLDVTELTPRNLEEKYGYTVNVTHGGQMYVVPADVALPLSASDSFRLTMLEFDHLTCEQQKLLIEEVQWINNYTGFYTLESIRKSCSSYLLKAPIYAMEYMLSPLNYLLEKSPLLLVWATKVMIFGVIAWSLYSLGKVLTGTNEETSKYLHRGPKSNVIYHGRLTSHDLQHNEAFLKKFSQRNARLCTLSDEGGNVIQCQALLNGRFAIIPKHVLRNLGSYITIGFQLPGSEDSIKYGVNRKNFIESPTSDLCVVSSSAFPQLNDITKHFLTQSELETFEIPTELTLISRDKDGVFLDHKAFLRQMAQTRLRLQDGSMVSSDKIVILSGSTTVGKSGSAAIGFQNSSQAKILGIQIWAMSMHFCPEIAVQVVSREHLLELQERCTLVCGFLPKREEQELQDVEILDGAFTSMEFNNVQGRSPFVLGKIGKSQFKTTPIAPYMECDGRESKRCPALLNPRDPRRITPIHPLNHSMGKYFRGTIQTMEEENRVKAKQWLSSLLTEKLGEKDFRSLSFSETITGTREDGSNPMDLNSSPGMPFVLEKRAEKGKRHWFNLTEEGALEIVDDKIIGIYDSFENSLVRGILPSYPCYDFPKDELRPISKALGDGVSPPKTRTVTCMSMLYSLAWRKYTLDFWASMHNAADGSFPFCPGINPEGPEWNSAFHYINRHPHVVDFDVSNWDGLLTSDVLVDVGEVISEQVTSNSTDQQIQERASRIIQAILFEISNSNIQYGDIIYQKLRGMVSGFPGTAEVNTLAHWYLILYFYIKLVPLQYKTTEALKAHVSYLIYGDDVIISFSDEISTWFNGLTIAQAYRDFGYTVTDGQKNSDIPFRKPISECSFLKSTWNELLPAIHIRKMDSSVAYDLLYWNRSKADPEEQFYSGCVDALRIMFGHGPEEFKKFQKELNRWLRKAKLPLLIYSYEDFMADHLHKYYSISI